MAVTETPKFFLSTPFHKYGNVYDGACEERSRREEEAMQGHRRRRETKRSLATPIRPKGGGGTVPSPCCSFSPMSLHRLVVAPRFGLRRAPNKRYRIYESEYFTYTCGITFWTANGGEDFPPSGRQIFPQLTLSPKTRPSCLL